MNTTGPHRFQARRDGSRLRQSASFWVLRMATYLVLLCGLAVFGNIAWKGSQTVFQARAPFINIGFLTERPETLYVFDWQGGKRSMGFSEFQEFRAANPAVADIPLESYVYSSGGIFPAIVGTVLLVVGSIVIALALGVSSAIYLNEYARDGKFIRFVRLAILNLAGVPSIVFGLFGFGLFVLFAPIVQSTPAADALHFRLWPLPLYMNFVGWNVSLLAGWFTLAFMVLPVVITASEESLKGVPMGFREGSLALGATRWQTIRRAVLPFALPGILTSSVLGIARVAGETAPIMFTAAYVVRDELPWQVERIRDFFFQGVMALPYHIYVVSSKIPQNEYTEKTQYGAAFVFLGVVAAIAATSIVLRNKFRNRYQW